MNKICLSIILVFNVFLIFGQCPTNGDSPKEKLQILDSLKNRSVKPNIKPIPLIVENFICKCKDEQKFSSNEYVSVTGYIVGVKYGGAETCECHSKDKNDLDYHIEIAANPNEKDKTNMMICEMTRFTRNMSISDIKVLIGHKVEIEGYLFFDEEHAQNAYNTNPNGTNLWRGTIWELHPVFNIKLIE